MGNSENKNKPDQGTPDRKGLTSRPKSAIELTPKLTAFDTSFEIPFPNTTPGL